MVPPGSFYNYSNANFMLAGLLAETAAGRPYREVVRHRVFNPLGMTRAAFLPSIVTGDSDIAYGVEANQVIAPDSYDNAIARPAGYAWASADDLAKFARFLLRGNPTVLSTRLWLAMQSRQVNMLEFLDYRAYGYGLVVEDALAAPDSQNTMRFYDGVRVVWHNGAINGYRSLMMTMPRQQFAYVALVNGSHDLFPCFRVAAAEAVGNRLPAPSPFPGPGIRRDLFVD
jgi:CubicO group peptidase (beta-lactamase class C family)